MERISRILATHRTKMDGAISMVSHLLYKLIEVGR